MSTSCAEPESPTCGAARENAVEVDPRLLPGASRARPSRLADVHRQAQDEALAVGQHRADRIGRDRLGRRTETDFDDAGLDEQAVAGRRAEEHVVGRRQLGRERRGEEERSESDRARCSHGAPQFPG